MAEKILNTRILMKVDTLENWNKSTLPLKKGELAFATVAASAGAGLTEPVVMVKIGEDGVKTFKDLSWNFYAKASDVLSACKDEAALKTFINGVITDAGVATDEALKTLSTQVTTNKDDIAALKTAVGDADSGLVKAVADLETLVGDTKVADQITAAIAALKLDETYDAKGAADQALTDAKGYADGLNTAMNTRVEALEAIDHDHANKAELDLIETGDKAKWDAMEQNAKDYADGLDEAMNTRVEALEGMFGDGEGTVESQIAAAVATETAAREAADTALDNRVKAIEDDYLKAADKTALQEQITANDGEIAALQSLVGDKKVSEQITDVTNPLDARVAAIEGDYLKAADKKALQDQIDANESAIELLTNGVSAEEVDGVNDLIQYVKDHGTEVTGMKANIKANADAIDAIEADYLKAADKNALQGEIDALEGRMDTAEGAIATKAAQADLEALAGRVSTVEGDLNAETTGLKARMTAAGADIDALEAKVGDETVSEQITAVTNPLAERVVALEAVDHSHANAAELDKIADGDKAKWDAKLEDVTAAVDSGLKATKTGNTVAIAIDDSITFVFDCGNASV